MAALEGEIPGFSFRNSIRNEKLEKDTASASVLPKIRKTGTTTCGIIFRDGVVLGADTRATEDTLVADKNCQKIHYMAKRIYCLGAGTAADCDFLTRMMCSRLELLRMNIGREPRVVTVGKFISQYLFRYQGYISAALVIGGVDETGPHLCDISPDGAILYEPYVSMGSGSLAAMAVLEKGFKLGMEREEAMLLVKDAVRAGVFNDLGSGSNVDLCVITKDSTNYYRTFDQANVKGKRIGEYKYPKGSTAVLSKSVKDVEFFVESMKVKHIPMETDEGATSRR